MTSSDPSSQILEAAGLFVLRERVILEVSGSDRTRWLDGMVTGDVASLSAGPPRGRRALLLTHQGRILADLQVVWWQEFLWLEMDATALEGVQAQFEKLIVADDVALTDCTGDWSRLALEGPRSRAVLAAALGRDFELQAGDATDVDVGGARCTVAAFGFTSVTGLQLFAPMKESRAVCDALRSSGSALGLVEGNPETLELLRIEAGVPRYGAELDESVLPAEAGLDALVSTTKGCYTGQEVVARLRTQGKVGHRLVGLSFASEELPEPGARLAHAGKRVGEVTSVVLSPRFGPIGLGFARSEHAAPGGELETPLGLARVESLPFQNAP